MSLGSIKALLEMTTARLAIEDPPPTLRVSEGHYSIKQLSISRATGCTRTIPARWMPGPANAWPKMKSPLTTLRKQNGRGVKVFSEAKELTPTQRLGRPFPSPPGGGMLGAPISQTSSMEAG